MYIVLTVHCYFRVELILKYFHFNIGSVLTSPSKLYLSFGKYTYMPILLCVFKSIFMGYNAQPRGLHIKFRLILYSFTPYQFYPCITQYKCL